MLIIIFCTAISLRDVFGIAGYHTWAFPVDPVFADYDDVMGFTTPERLVREQQRLDSNKRDVDVPSVEPNSSGVELPSCVNEFLPIWKKMKSEVDGDWKWMS